MPTARVGAPPVRDNTVFSPTSLASWISASGAITKPQLEILANDVRCTHGATLSQVDREQLFYLMARGLPRAEAERLIVRGFFQDVLDRIDLEPVREELLSLGEQGATVAVRQRRTATREVVFAARDVPGFGWRSYQLEPGDGPATPVRAEGTTLAAGDQIGVEISAPKGTIYVWAPVPEGHTSTSFAELVLEEAAVIVSPGSMYGPSGEGFFRISLTTPDDRISEAVERMREHLS